MTPHDQSVPCFYHGAACGIPYGFCHCRCGKKTNIIQQTQRRQGDIKGKPFRFVGRHGRRAPRPDSRVVVINGVEYQTIPLTKGMEAIVDIVDYERLAQHCWYAQEATTRSGFYAMRTEGHAEEKITISMHGEVFGALKPDHIDGDGLHNWRTNLRAATVWENGWNYLGNSRNTSGFRGVTRKRNRWRASLMVKRVLVLAKDFDSKEEAARAVDEAVKEYHGAFARLNFPEG